MSWKHHQQWFGLVVEKTAAERTLDLSLPSEFDHISIVQGFAELQAQKNQPKLVFLFKPQVLRGD